MACAPSRAPQALGILFAVSAYCQKHGISTDVADGRSPSVILGTVLETNQQVHHLVCCTLLAAVPRVGSVAMQHAGRQC